MDAFVTGLALTTRRQSRARKGNRSRPTRASATPQSDGQKAGLERLFRLEMIPTKGRRAETTCIWCNGAKECVCSWCKGRGYRENTNITWQQMQETIAEMERTGNPQPIPKHRVECSACSGSKKLRCRYCRGSGIGSYGFAH